MTQKITGEAPFQVLATNFSISPSLQNYILQISADGINYSDLFTVSAGQTKMVTNVANGSYYRLKNNQSEVTINWRTQCNDGQGGGGGTADYATSAGTANVSNSTKLLEGSSALPQDANTGDVVAVAPTPTRGLRSANTALGIYQYDGTDWNKIEGGSGSGSSAYKIELSEVDPSNYTQEDRATLNAFCTAYSADTSIADSAYISALNGIYRCVRYSVTPQLTIFTFEGTYNNNIVDIELHFLNNTFAYGGLQDAVPSPDFTTLEAVSELPQDANTGDVVAVSIPAQEGKWVEFDASENPTKVRIMTKSDGTYLLHFNNNNLYTGLDYTAGDPPTFSGSGWGLQQDDTYNWHYENNGYYISVWAEQEGDDWCIYAEMTQGEGGFSMIDAYGLGSWSEMYVGGTEGSIGVYQYDGEDWVKIGEGGGDFIHLDSIGITGEVGKTYEFEGRLMQWVEGSGYTAEWLKNIGQLSERNEGTGLIYAVIPDNTKLFEYKYPYGGEWRYVVYNNGKLYCTETGGTVVASASTGEEFNFPASQNGNIYQVRGILKNGYIGFFKNGYISCQNVWDGSTNVGHFELIDKDNYPYIYNPNEGYIYGVNEKGQAVLKKQNFGTKIVYFNNTGYSNSIGYLTNGTGNGPERIWVPTTGGQTGQTLVSAGDNSAPVWETRIKVVKITSDAYEALVQAGTTDPNTLYAIVDE